MIYHPPSPAVDSVPNLVDPSSPSYSGIISGRSEGDLSSVELKNGNPSNIEEEAQVYQEELDEYLFNRLDSPSPSFVDCRKVTKLVNGKVCEYYDGQVVINYNGRRLVLTESKLVEQGSFGALAEYKLGNISYAIKISKNPSFDGNEREAIISLRQQEQNLGRTCNLISARIVEGPISVVMMPFMDGDIINLFAREDLPKGRDYVSMLDKLIQTVRNQMNCLLSLNEGLEERRFGYIDLRPDNVLYKKNETDDVKNLFSFKLCDLGSIVPVASKGGDFWAPIYWIPNTDKSPSGVSLVRSETLIESMRYVFAIFVCEITNIIGPNEFKRPLTDIQRKVMSGRFHMGMKKYGFTRPETYANLLYDERYEKSGGTVRRKYMYDID